MLFIGDNSASTLLPFLIWSLQTFSSLCANDCGNITTTYKQHKNEKSDRYNDGDTHEGEDLILTLIPSQHVQSKVSQYQFRWLFFNGKNWTVIRRHYKSVTIYNLNTLNSGKYRLECWNEKQVYCTDVVINSSKPMKLNPQGESNETQKTPPTSGVSATVFVAVTVCPVLVITVGMILAINLKKRHSSVGQRSIDSSDTNGPSRFVTEDTTMDIYAVSHYQEINDLLVDSSEKIPLAATCDTELGSTDYCYLQEGLDYDFLPPEEKLNRKPLNGEDINCNSTYTNLFQRQDTVDRSFLCFVSSSGYAAVKPKEQRRRSCPGGQGTNMESRFQGSFSVLDEYATVLPRAYRKHSQTDLLYIQIDHRTSKDDIVNHYDTVINMPLDPPCIYSTIDFDKKAFVAPLRRAPSSWYMRKQK